MQVTVTRTLIVPEEVVSINEMEAVIQSWGQEVMGVAFALVWQQLTRPDLSRLRRHPELRSRATLPSAVHAVRSGRVAPPAAAVPGLWPGL